MYIPKGEAYKITLDDEESVTIVIDFDIVTAPAAPFCRFHRLYSQAYVDKKFKISHMVESSGLSSKYIEVLFQKNFNMTPKEYVTFLRIERAKKLLLSEKASVSEIADQLGFCDVYHFGKVFKLKTGYTPRQYSNSTSSNIPVSERVNDQHILP